MDITQIVMHVLSAVEIICALLLLGIILIQKPKSHGAGFAFGANMGETLFGGQAGNVLTRTTVILMVIFLLNTTLLAYLGTKRRSVVDTLESKAPPALPVAPKGPEMPQIPVSGAGGETVPVMPSLPPAQGQAPDIAPAPLPEKVPSSGVPVSPAP